MKSGYKILWTKNALQELRETIEYLEENFSDKEINKLAQRIESTIKLISYNPDLFQKSEFDNIHKAVILKHNTMFYRIKNNTIEIVSFFSNRKSPNKKRL